MPVLLALGACCAIPFLVGAFMFLTGRKRNKEEDMVAEADIDLIEQRHR